MNISLKSIDISHVKKIKYPSKRVINLLKPQRPPMATWILALCITGIVLAAFAVAKFGVIDQYARLSLAQRDSAQAHDELVTAEDELARYPEVLHEYRRYSLNWLKNESAEDGEDESEYVAVDRLDVLDLIETYMMSSGTVNAINIHGEVLQVSMSGMNLQQVSSMFSTLEKQPIVKSAQMTIAQTEQSLREGDMVDFSMTIALQAESEATAE